MKRFEGKTAIVTGATGGIGLAICKRLAEEGAKVVAAALRQDAVDDAARQTKAAGAPDAFGVVCDVSEQAAVEAAVKACIERFGRLDVVVNNAGLMTFKRLEDFTQGDWIEVFAVDLLGAVHFTREAFHRMGPGGAIVNIASVHAVMTTPNVAPYAAAKAALLSLTRSSAIEGKPKGIRANAILPGAIDTPMLWSNPNLKSGAEKLDPKDVGKPEDIAGAVAFLASADAAFVTGASLEVDGGRLAQL
jgi:meso-butanediol dehydrogenase / (S,S)-butanediol dehydrogenase / diacetyl reductase